MTTFDISLPFHADGEHAHLIGGRLGGKCLSVVFKCIPLYEGSNTKKKPEIYYIIPKSPKLKLVYLEHLLYLEALKYIRWARPRSGKWLKESSVAEHATVCMWPVLPCTAQGSTLGDINPWGLGYQLQDILHIGSFFPIRFFISLYQQKKKGNNLAMVMKYLEYSVSQIVFPTRP